MNLHIFNPETEYALASGSASYTPPKKVVEISQRMALLPALYAFPGDYILIRDRISGFVSKSRILEKICKTKDLNLCFSDNLKEFSNIKNLKILPWGWNYDLKRWLIDRGMDENKLPSDSFIENLRHLAHRRTTIKFHGLAVTSNISNEFIPIEITTVKEALEFRNKIGEVYFKAPWSSSGRGILYSKELTDIQIEQWIRGIIRDQGSVLAEKAHNRILDFGSEWIYDKGQAIFQGFSAFKVSPRGKYKFNQLGSYEHFVDKFMPDFLKAFSLKYDKGQLIDIVFLQKKILEFIIGEKYDGPVGIDMFITDKGTINPCVEINFRNTMGKVALDISSECENNPHSAFAEIIKSLFPDGKMDLKAI